MSRTSSCPERRLSKRVFFALIAFSSAALPASAAGDAIARIARTFNDDLVRIESRIDWLETRLHTLATPRECRLGNGFGFRGGRPDPNSPTPWVQLDLGAARSLDNVFLIPAQPESGSCSELFPRRFLLQASNDPTFGEFEVLMDQTSAAQSPPNGCPLAIHGQGIEARYIRMTVVEGTDLGCCDAFALSELLVIAGGQPVSLGAAVDSSWADRVNGAWEPRFLTDGRSPLGLWEGGSWSPSRGMLIPTEEIPPFEPLEIVVDLGRDMPIDRIHLLPLESVGMPGIGVLPHEYLVGLTAEGSDECETIYHHHGDDQRTTELSPRVIQAGGQRARYLRMTCLRPWSYGDRHAYAIAHDLRGHVRAG